MLHLGIDIGSKTVKLVVLDESGALIHDSYERHLSNVVETLRYTLRNAARYFPCEKMTVGVTGSAGMQFAELLDLPFTQEVIAARVALARFIPDADVAIEIGGEDSKILFLTGGEELRMNSTCAGGTGGFIDTIAGMLDANAEKLNFYALGCRTIHPIASRCAVFAQADVRPLINEGVPKEDIAGSAFDAVVTQCLSGLACGRPLTGTVALLGGPLHFLSALRERFRVRLGLDARDLRVPTDGHLFVAKGAALDAWEGAVAAGGAACAEASGVAIPALADLLDRTPWEQGAALERLDPLFASQEEYTEFKERHARLAAPRASLPAYEGPVYLGVDSGSEAIKYALIGQDGQLLRTYYERSAGSVIEAARDMLVELWKHLPLKHDGTPAAWIAHATVTGYGEGYLKAAYAFDSGEVETIAHVRAAQELVPDADFILDIGGQDMKCLFLRDGIVDNVVLNEACSSGCGALLSGMAWSMNVRFDRFLESALLAPAPVDLGTRCTVFMTSRVRHAQKEGASLGDLSAGLAYSVVRNAIYKVIRARDIASLGKRIVVQGGTFMNDAVLRAFEKLSGAEVARPDIAPYMGAFGAALIARDRAQEAEAGGDDARSARSTLLSRRRIEQLESVQETRTCTQCANACTLITTTFADGGMQRTFTVGNRCERGAGSERTADGVGQVPNLFDVRLRRLFGYRPRAAAEAPRGEVGFVRALGMYDLYPFWFTLFDRLGFRVVLSRPVGAALRGRAIETIPSESLCYPAKLAHGHVVDLIERGVRTVFLPFVGSARGGASCPVLAGYPLVLEANVDALRDADVRLVMPQVKRVLREGQADPCMAPALLEALGFAEPLVTRAEVEDALAAAAAEQRRFEDDMAAAGRQALSWLAREKRRGVVLAGRPYHNDPAVHHAVPDLLCSYGLAVLTEDAVAPLAEGGGCGPGCDADVEGAGAGWEYPERVLAAARVVAARDDLDMVELYSFGCGLDAVTVDRVRDVLEAGGKALTALKIDEMVDLAATRIRIRSMMAAQEGRIGRRAAHGNGAVAGGAGGNGAEGECHG